MLLERWQRTKEIFAAAIEQSCEDRQTFLKRECAGDEDLEREVNLLLQNHESPHDFLAPPIAFRAGIPQVGLPTLAEGSHFGKYTVLRLVGSGGMGHVYLAEDTRLKRKVALKLLPSWLNLDAGSVARFEQEALAASALNHSNVPVVYEADQVDGYHYIATEFVNGMTLSERISRGRLAWAQGVAIAIQVGHALAAAHAVGIIHRDVKPSNILIREDETVKLTDFGIAKLLERTGPVTPPRAVTTAVGTLMGTPAYMSPEQTSGQPVDERTDIWSLAAVLHEMIVGGAPLAGENLLRTSRCCPRAIWKAVDRALQPDRELRYSTMREFVTVLESDQSSRAGSRAVTFAWYGGVTALLGILLLAGYLGLRVQQEQGNAELFRPDRIYKLTTSGKAVDAAMSPDDRYVVYVVNDSGRHSIRLRELSTGADLERVGVSNAIYSDLTFTPDGNSFYYLKDQTEDLRTLYRAPLLGGPPSKVIEDVDSPPAISPDGRWIEFERGNPSADKTALYVVSADGTSLRQIAARPYARAFLFDGACWSLNGESIFTAALEGPDRAEITEVQLSNGKQKQLSHSGWRWVGRISSVSGGHNLVFPAAEQESVSPQIYQMSLTQKKVNAVTADLASYRKVSASGRSIVTVQEDRLSAIWLTALKNLPRSRRVTPPSGRYWQLALLPDGSLLSQTGTGRELNVWRMFEDGSRKQVTSGPYFDWNTVASADGKRLAFVSNRGAGLHLWTADLDGHFLRQLTSGDGRISSPSFMPDGSIVYCETKNGSASILKISSDGGTPVRLLSTQARNPVVSPNGRYLACELKESRWQTAIVDLQTARVIRRFPDIPYDSWVRWTADGKAVAYIATNNGVSNIAAKTLADGSEILLTSFGENMIFSFDIARNGEELASIRGIAVSDIVVFQGAR